MRTQTVAFIPAIGAAGNDLFIDGIGFWITSLIVVSLTWFSTSGDIADCEGVEWGAFDVMAVSKCP